MDIQKSLLFQNNSRLPKPNPEFQNLFWFFPTMHSTCELLKKGSVYFTAKMLAATDRLSYCAASRTFGLVAWPNTKKKVTLSGKHCPASGAKGLQAEWLGVTAAMPMVGGSTLT